MRKKFTPLNTSDRGKISNDHPDSQMKKLEGRQR
jgi:hypothetical protein